jgi:hypothetical protein
MMFLRIFAAAIIAIAVFAPAAHAQSAVRRDDSQFVASSRGEVYYWIGCDGWKRLTQRSGRFRMAAWKQPAPERPPADRRARGR